MKTYDPGQTLGVNKTGFKEMTSLAISVEGRGTLLDIIIKIAHVSNRARVPNVSHRIQVIIHRNNNRLMKMVRHNLACIVQGDIELKGR